MSTSLAEEEDRRRSPRFSCGGYANVNCLPSNGIALPGAILDLSLGGCRIATTSPINRGTRAEIFVRVNAASFRALGEVRAVRGNSGAGLEFVQLSAGGREMLTDLVTDLARLHAVMDKLKATRRGIEAKSFREKLEYGKLQSMLLGQRVSWAETMVPAGSMPTGNCRFRSVRPSRH
jgi:hypothetical protein